MVHSSLHRADSSGYSGTTGQAPCRQSEPTPVFLGNLSPVSLALWGHKASSLRSGRVCAGGKASPRAGFACPLPRQSFWGRGWLWQGLEQPQHPHRRGSSGLGLQWERWRFPGHTARMWSRTSPLPLRMPPWGSHPESWVPGSLCMDS